MSLQGSELSIKRTGIWRPIFELKDEQHSYGKLSHKGTWKPKVIIETAQKTWVISGMGWRNAKISTDQEGEVAWISQDFWRGKTSFSAHDGFTAKLVRPSFWKNIMTWVTPDGTELVRISGRIFNQPVISINPQAPQNPWLLLLAFLLLEMYEMRKRHAAAAAS